MIRAILGVLLWPRQWRKGCAQEACIACLRQNSAVSSLSFNTKPAEDRLTFLGVRSCRKRTSPD